MKIENKADGLTVTITVVEGRKYAIATFDNGSEYVMSGDANTLNEVLLANLLEALHNSYEKKAESHNAIEKDLWRLEKLLDKERDALIAVAREADAISELLRVYTKENSESYPNLP